MKELLTQIVNMGIGAVAFTKDAAEKVVNELIEKGEMTRKEGDEFIDKLAKRGEEAKNELESKIEKKIQDILKKLKIPTRDEVDALKKKVNSIAKKCEK